MKNNTTHKLSIIFKREYFDNLIGIPNHSENIPISTVGYVLTATNDLMRSTWDYANASNDERFESLRKNKQSIQRHDFELVINYFYTGSLEVELGWVIPFLHDISLGVASNALWDLAKYSFLSIHQLIANLSNNNEKKLDNDDPLLNRILPDVIALARYGSKEFGKSTISTGFYYRDQEREIEFKIDPNTKNILLETNYVETKIITRLAGIIEGINWRRKNITVRWDFNPDDETICDIDGMDIDELNRLLSHSLKTKPTKLGFDVELAWRKGVANTFPPDSIRIIGIMPEKELLHPAKFLSTYRGLQRPSIGDNFYHIELSKDEIKFLKWFEWADKNWDDPNISGIVNYLSINPDILEQNTGKKRIQEIIQSLVKFGIILMTRGYTKHGTQTYCIRLNRNHPFIIESLK